MKVVLQRAESKDYRDIVAILNAGGDLAAGLAAASALFGPSFQPSESLRALVFFRDGDLASLSESDARSGGRSLRRPGTARGTGPRDHVVRDKS